MRTPMILACAAVLALGACGDGESEDADATDNVALDSEAMAPLDANLIAPVAAVPATGSEYAATVAASDMFEIESAGLAAQKATNADVKSFAAMLQKDHRKSTADLRTAAAQASPAVTVAPQMNPEQQANMQALQAASGPDFDRIFLEQQVAAHEKALSAVQGYAQSGEVPSLKQHAATVAGPIEEHLSKARELIEAAR